MGEGGAREGECAGMYVEGDKDEGVGGAGGKGEDDSASDKIDNGDEEVHSHSPRQGFHQRM